MRTILGLVAAVAAGVGLAMPVAQAGERELSLKVEREIVAYTVNADGSYTEAREQTIRVLKDSALDSAKSASVSYSTSIQKARDVVAYTFKADGRRIPVPAGNFQVNSSAGQNGDSPFYSDQTTLTAVFPDLAVGDATVFSYRLEASKPMFDGQFSVIENFSPTTYYGDVRISIDAPESMAAQHEAWQLHETGDRVRDGRRRIEWQWSNRKPADPESLRDGVFKYERYPGYAYSTFASYAAIAQAYGERAEAKAAVTPRIRKLADDTAGDAKEPREAAKRLYEWVSRNISYAGNCIGLGAVVPRDLDVVLDNRMGDCKDHATLLQALLAARGIASTQALINAGGSYSMPKVPVASVVNHVINYVPGLDLYLDSTAATVPFASLPDGLYEKPVLLVSGHHDDAKTPARQMGNDWQKLQTRLSIQPDGSVKGSQRLELSGRLAVAAREQFRNMPADDADKLVKRYFRGSGYKANGKLRFDDPKPMLEKFWIEADFDIERALPLSGGLPVQPWFVSFAPVSGTVARNLGDEETPAGESGCGGILTEETFTFEFPSSMRIAAVPADASVQEGNVRYAATFRRQGNRIEASRSLDDRTPGPVCTAEYNAEYAKTMRDIFPGLRQQIVYLDDAGKGASP